MRGHQRVAEDADLEARAADAGEQARARLRERAVEHVGGGVERAAGPTARSGSGRLSSSRVRVVGQRLAGRGLVEGPPGLEDQLGGVLEHVLAVGQREGGPLGRGRIAG